MRTRKQKFAAVVLLALAILLGNFREQAQAGIGQIVSVVTQMFGAPVQVVGVPTNGQVLTYSSASGTWIAAAGVAAGSLQGAYNGGNTIAEAGALPVALSSTGNDTGSILTVVKNPGAGPQAGAGVLVTMQGNTSGPAFSAAANGSGPGLLLINQASTSGDLVSLSNVGTGNAINIGAGNNGTGNGILLTMAGASTAAGYHASMNNGSTGAAFLMDSANAGTSLFIEAKDGSTSAVSLANEGRIRYNSGTQAWEQSVNTGAWAAFGGGGGSLQASYNLGAAISVTSALGPVAITAPLAQNVNGLTITESNTSKIGLLVTSQGSGISAPGSGSNSERFGLGALAPQLSGTALGNTAIAGQQSVAVGHLAGNANLYSFAVSVGDSALAGNGCVAIGQGSTANGISIGEGAVSETNSIVIGLSASDSGATGPNIIVGTGSTIGAGSFVGCILMGPSASLNGSARFVAGSATGPVNDVFFGKGDRSTSPTTYTVNGTQGSGAGVAGGALRLAGGNTTDATATGGPILFAAATGGVRTDRWALLPATGTLNATSGLVLGFSSNASDPAVAPDTGISRFAAGLLAVGNGTFGDVSGEVRTALGTFGTGVSAGYLSSNNGGTAGFDANLNRTGVSMGTACVLAWTSGVNTSGGYDAGVSRISSSTVAVGNGTNTDATGTLATAGLTLNVVSSTSGTIALPLSSTHNNAGAVTGVTFMLPHGAGTGTTEGFRVVAAQNVVIQAQAGDVIYMGVNVSPSGGTWTTNVPGSTAELEYEGSGVWMATSVTGSGWTHS